MRIYVPSWFIDPHRPWTKFLAKYCRVVIGPTWGYLGFVKDETIKSSKRQRPK